MSTICVDSIACYHPHVHCSVYTVYGKPQESIYCTLYSTVSIQIVVFSKNERLWKSAERKTKNVG